VLAFDFGTNLVADIPGAAAELRSEGAAKVVLVGASMGGAASLVVATMVTPPVSGVASVSGPAEYRGIDTLAAAKQLK